MTFELFYYSFIAMVLFMAYIVVYENGKQIKYNTMCIVTVKLYNFRSWCALRKNCI